MSNLKPLIDLASQKNLDLFFRLGRGYVTRAVGDPSQRAAGHGLSPYGVQTNAEIRIVMSLPHPRPEQRMSAWPEGPRPSRISVAL
jgi:hypothetical protein